MHKGLIELGQGGTVFLDEIGDMPVGMQAKLLTVLEDKLIRRVGGEKWVTVDVRFVAATNKDSATLLHDRVLREDLYYRLAMNQVHILPLRERPEDIPCLIDHALAEFNEKNGIALSLHADVVRHLQTLSWPGNVRELKNVVWQIASESGEESGEITWLRLPADLRRTLTRQRETPGAGPHTHPTPAERDAAEEQQLRGLCAQWQGDVYAMADALGVHRTTIIRKLKRYGLSYACKSTSCPIQAESSSPSPLSVPADDNGRQS